MTTEVPAPTIGAGETNNQGEDLDMSYREQMALVGIETLLREAKTVTDPEWVKVVMEELALRMLRVMKAMGAA